MSKIKISFILPCYNVESYIGRCLDSLLHQDMTIEEYEIICVNDCSPDNLRNIVFDYQRKYPNIRLIEHAVNKTSGGARNTGIDAARGEYLWFVDPDDFVAENCLGTVYRSAKKNKTDILFFNYKSVGLNGEYTIHNIVKESTDNCDGISYVNKMFPQKRIAGISAIWHSIFRREFCVKNNIRFPEIKSSQDVIFVWKCLLTANHVISSDVIGYTVCERLNSMTGSVGKFKPDAIFSATILYANELLNVLDEYSNINTTEMKNDIARAIKLSLDDGSKKILYSSLSYKKEFFIMLLQNKVLVDKLYPYMSFNTRQIFNYKSNVFFWLLFVELFRAKRAIKSFFAFCHIVAV